MTSSKPPVEPKKLASGLRSHFDNLEATLKVQSIRREHATERQGLRSSTDDLRRWREQYLVELGSLSKGDRFEFTMGSIMTMPSKNRTANEGVCTFERVALSEHGGNVPRGHYVRPDGVKTDADSRLAVRRVK